MFRWRLRYLCTRCFARDANTVLGGCVVDGLPGAGRAGQEMVVAKIKP